MAEEIYGRRRISLQQLELLAQYMERYPTLALATARSREGHIQRKRTWEKIARTLNRVDHSQPKSGIGWCRYWGDLKFKLRRKYSVIRRCQNDGTHCTIELGPLEYRFIKVLTDEDGNLLSTGSVYQQMLHAPIKENVKTHLKSLDNDSKIDDSGGLNDISDDANDDTNHDYLLLHDRLPEHILLPDSSDTKPIIRNDVDPIQILPEGKKSIEELKRELVEFELRRQKELFEMEKQQKIEKHELEMSILRLKKQMMLKEFKK